MANFARMLDTGAKTNKLVRRNQAQDNYGFQQQAAHQQQQQEEEKQPDLVLYVWGSKEKASRNALRLRQELSVDHVTVVNLQTLEKEEFPSWLRGVPTMLSISEETIWEGTDCLDYIEELAEMEVERRMAKRQPKQPQQHIPSIHDFPMQTMPDGSQIQQRMPQMMRGVDQ